MKYLLIIICTAALMLLPAPAGYTDTAMPEAVNLEKTPVHHFYAYDFTDIVKSKNRLSLPAEGITDFQIEAEAGKAGWEAFSGYFSLEGAGATVLQECLGASFLENINSVCGEIGGAMVVVQLMIDLANKDYLMAGLNFSKGSIYYSIGKWGTKAMKVGAAGAAAVEWYLTTVTGMLNKKHDDFYYDTLKWYFYNGDGNKSLEEWEKIFLSADIRTPDDILKIVDDHVETFWISDNMYNAISDAKQSWGIVGADPLRFQLKKEHFKAYATAIYVLPYIKPMLRRLAEEQTDKAAQKLADQFNKVNDELNGIYVIKGIVKGPPDKIKNLLVRIPGFLETHTDTKGRFKFRFTLYSFLKYFTAGSGSHGLVVEVSSPSNDFSPLVKRGKIREEYRKAKEIRLLFEVPSSAGSVRIVAERFKDPIQWYSQITGTLEMILSLEQKTAVLNVDLTKTMHAELAQKKGRAADLESSSRNLFIDSVWTDKNGTIGKLSIAPEKKMVRSAVSNRIVMVEEINWEKGTARGYYMTTCPWNSTLKRKALTIKWEGRISGEAP